MKMFKLFLIIGFLNILITNIFAESYLIREDRVWEYEGSIPIGPWFQYKMRFDGDTVVDGTRYNILHTFDGITKEGQEDAKPADGLKFLLREENGKIYVLVQEYVWPTDKTEEKLLYDFNVEAGNELSVVDNFGCLVNMTVTSIYNCTIREEDCKVYIMSMIEHPYLEYTIVEGIGNVSLGCIPLIITDICSGGGSGTKYTLPGLVVEQHMKRVYDNEGNVICEKDADGLWPWEKTEGVTVVETASRLSFDGKAISAESEFITLYTFSGNAVAKGYGEVSTENLQPGVYVAKAGGQTLKILVK